jgi:hypothetical protein
MKIFRHEVRITKSFLSVARDEETKHLWEYFCSLNLSELRGAVARKVPGFNLDRYIAVWIQQASLSPTYLKQALTSSTKSSFYTADVCYPHPAGNPN